MKLIAPLNTKLNKDKNIPLVLWIWRSYFRTSLIPLLCVEVALIVIYFMSNSISNSENVEALRQLAEGEAKQVSILEAKGISRQLESISQATTFLQIQTGQIMGAEKVLQSDDPARFAYSKDGVFYTNKNNGGSAVFYSGVYAVGESERQKAYRSAGLDPAYIGIKQSNSLIVQVYYNTFDSLNRIYPYIDVLSAYTPKMDIPSFNFYYEADAKHNPKRKVVWTDVYKDPAGQGWMTSAIAPVYIAKKLEGVVGVDVTVDTIVAEVLDLKIPWQGYGLLVSRDGNVIAMPKVGEQDWGKKELTAKKIEGENSHNTLAPAEFNIYTTATISTSMRKLVDSIRKHDTGIMSADLGGKRIVSWSLIPETGWKLIITIPEDKIFHSVQTLSHRLDRFAWLMVFGLLIFYVIFFFVLYRQAKKMSKAVSEPLERIDEMVKAVATGNSLTEVPEFKVSELSRTAQGVMMMGQLLDAASRSRQKMEAKLEERSQQLQSVFDLSPNGLIFTDENAKVVLVNPALCEMTGLKPSEWLLNQDKVIWQKIAQLTANPMAVLPGSEQTFRLELERPRKRVLKCQIMNVNDKEASSAVKLIFFRDITRDDEVDQMKSQFITTAAHELRTPLTSVLGYSELLMKDMIPQAMRESAFEVVINKTKLLINIINEMLDLARIEARNGLDFNITSYLADGLVSATVATYPLALDRNPIIIETLPNLRVNVDDEKFKAVLTNLLDNAYKYSTTGNVKLQIIQDNLNGVVSVGFRVQDSGVGMSDEHRLHAFDRFWRADESGNIPGTGLGLAIVKEVMRVLGGSVEIESALGIGTTVTLWLPHAHERRATTR